MELIPENPNVKTGLKGAIAIGMVGATGLSLYKLYLLSHGGILAPVMNTLTTVACVAVVAHGIEGGIAGAIAYRRGKNVFNAGFYAFFTGFVGLSEMLNNRESESN